MIKRVQSNTGGEVVATKDELASEIERLSGSAPPTYWSKSQLQERLDELKQSESAPVEETGPTPQVTLGAGGPDLVCKVSPGQYVAMEGTGYNEGELVTLPNGIALQLSDQGIVSIQGEAQ